MDTDVVERPKLAVVGTDHDQRPVASAGRRDLGGEVVADPWYVDRAPDAQPVVAEQLDQLPLQHVVGPVGGERQHPGLLERQLAVPAEFVKQRHRSPLRFAMDEWTR